jgi:hypothetical protein
VQAVELQDSPGGLQPRVILGAGQQYSMTANEPSPGLQPRDFTEQRNDALREGVKGLLLINGGGATAMLAFLQATWTTKPQLAKYLVQFFRYQASFSFQGGRSRAFGVYRRLYLTAAYMGLSSLSFWAY